MPSRKSAQRRSAGVRRAAPLKYNQGVLAATTKYALKAPFALAEKPTGQLVPVEQLSEESGVPAAYLSKIMKALVKLGFVRARKGARGGVCLSDSTKSLSVFDVCVALKDPIADAQCMLNHGPCNRAAPCRMHHRWQGIVNETRSFLKSSLIESEDPAARGCSRRRLS